MSEKRKVKIEKMDGGYTVKVRHSDGTWHRSIHTALIEALESIVEYFDPESYTEPVIKIERIKRW